MIGSAAHSNVSCCDYSKHVVIGVLIVLFHDTISAVNNNNMYEDWNRCQKIETNFKEMNQLFIFEITEGEDKNLPITDVQLEIRSFDLPYTNY
jgi:hypothetical protein